MRYSPRVVSEHCPDLSTLERMLEDRRFAGQSGQDLAIALWALMVDRDLGLFHYLPAQERFRRGQDVYDPLQVWNVFGFTICHCHAHVLGTMAQAAGFPARIATIRGHEGTEIFCDGAWRYFDGDIQMFHRQHPPREAEIASRQDTFADLSLVDGQGNPSRPYMLPDRPPEVMRPLYADPPHYLPVLDEGLHEMDFRLRPGESMTRYFHPCGRWAVFDNYPEMFARYSVCKGGGGPSEPGPEGPTERFWPRRRHGNGFFHYAPRIGRDWQDLAAGSDCLDGIALVPEGAVAQGAMGTIQMPFESPYLLCGVPDPLGRVPPALGASVKAAFRLPRGTSAAIAIRPYDGRRAGQAMPLTEIWASAGADGEALAQADYTALVEGLYVFDMVITLTGQGAALASLENHLWFMVSPHSLPRLMSPGDNRMSVRHGDRFGLPTRPFLLERWIAGTGDLPDGVAAAENLLFRPDTYSRVMPRDPRQPWAMTVPVQPPHDGTLQWLTVFATVEGIRPGEANDGTPFRIAVAESPDGPWQPVAEALPVPHPQGWHSTILGRARLSGDRHQAYVRFSAKQGMSLFRIAGHYAPRQAGLAAGRLDIEHAWYEDDPAVGRRLRTHLEQEVPETHEYRVRCAATPHNERIVLRCPSLPAPSP